MSNTNNLPQRLMSRVEVAEFLGVARSTVDKWRLKGLIPYVKIGSVAKFTPKDVADFVKAHRTITSKD